MISSIGYNQIEILHNIRELHLGGKQFEYDPTFSKGIFYLGRIGDSIPKYVSDLHPQFDFVQQRDCRNTVFPKNKLNSIIFDPPFLSRTGDGSIIKDRFGEYPSMPALWKFYAESAAEFNRILKPKGILAWKCQNTVMGGKQWWSHNYIINMCKELGLDLKDEFVLLSKNRMERTGTYTQRHARKFHSYFLVFIKR